MCVVADMCECAKTGSRNTSTPLGVQPQGSSHGPYAVLGRGGALRVTAGKKEKYFGGFFKIYKFAYSVHGIVYSFPGGHLEETIEDLVNVSHITCMLSKPNYEYQNSTRSETPSSSEETEPTPASTTPRPRRSRSPTRKTRRSRSKRNRE